MKNTETLGLPQQPYYRTRIDKAGALLRSMVKNHPFVDGNKRMGMATVYLFLLVNGYFMTATNEEMVAFALELAKSEPAMPWQRVARWIRGHSFSIESDVGMQRAAAANPNLPVLKASFVTLREAMPYTNELRSAQLRTS